MTTFLPLNKSDTGQYKPFTLDEVLKPPLSNELAPGQGHVLSLVICLQCLCHINQVTGKRSISHSNYDFWTQHNHLKELLDHVIEGPLAHLRATCYTTDCAILSLNLITQATLICLNHAALIVAGLSKGPADFIERLLEQNITSVLTIVETVRLVSRVNMKKVRLFFRLILSHA